MRDDLEARKVLNLVQRLRTNVDRAMGASGEEHARYSAAKTFATMYNKIVPRYNALVPDEQQEVFKLENMRDWADSLWPEQKVVCETVSLQTSIMEGLLLDNFDVRKTAEAEFYNFVEANLRRAMFKQPLKELDVQDALEGLLIGKGWQRESEYLRESGKVHFSGKEFIPDFVVLESNQAVELKLLKDIGKRTAIVEEMSADIPAYLSKYESVYFVVYDTAGLRDLNELRSGLEASGRVKMSLVKH